MHWHQIQSGHEDKEEITNNFASNNTMVLQSRSVTF
jgi:hypothetical protein